MEFVTANILVRPQNLPKLLHFAAQLEEEATGTGRATGHEDDRSRRWDQASVRESYLGGKSVVWRPFLEYLAARPDEWVPWGRADPGDRAHTAGGERNARRCRASLPSAPAI